MRPNRRRLSAYDRREDGISRRRFVLIAIEGIDGAGKTHISRKLARALAERGRRAVYVDKKDISFGDGFADGRLALIKEALWPIRGEPGQDLLGTRFYLHLLAAWFAATGRYFEHQAARNTDTLHVTDGSYYRVIAKAHLRSGMEIEHLRGFFTEAAEPDLVVLLDLEPRAAWARRSAFKETEIGRWDGFTGDPQEAFCAYQQQVRRVLRALCEKQNWVLIDQSVMHNDAEIVDHIMTQVERERVALKSEPEAQRHQTAGAHDATNGRFGTC
nr:hypothetical protein [Nitratireductor arenosus]